MNVNVSENVIKDLSNIGRTLTLLFYYRLPATGTFVRKRDIGLHVD
jgi:hypothetical protein